MDAQERRSDAGEVMADRDPWGVANEEPAAAGADPWGVAEETPEPVRDPYEPLGPPLPEAGGHRGPPRRISKPSPRSLPVGDALSLAFDQYGTSFDQMTGKPYPLVEKPGEYSVSPGGSLVES